MQWVRRPDVLFNRNQILRAAAVKSLQLCPTLCDPIDGSPPGTAVPGILQARTLEWVAISFSNAWKGKVKVKLLSHVRLLDPMDCSLPGCSIHGIFQARVLEWGAIAFSNLKSYQLLNWFLGLLSGPLHGHTTACLWTISWYIPCSVYPPLVWCYTVSPSPPHPHSGDSGTWERE